jgi:hypothetical protein
MNDLHIPTLLAVREAIMREPKLISEILWDEDGTPCAIGALMPRAERKYHNGEYLAKGFGASYERTGFNYAEFRKKYLNVENFYTLNKIALANNYFYGSPEARRDYMLKWLESELAAAASPILSIELVA